MARVLATVALASWAYAQTGVYSGAQGVYTVTQDTGSDTPLASKLFNYPDLPYQADTSDGPRGIQTGFNLCNSTTQNQQSRCQTGFLNAVDDFCIWGAPDPNSIVADVEGEMVAYCTKKRYGARLIPQGAIQGIQFMKTPGYVQIVGFLDQTAINLQASDSGGEEDNAGADGRGNPLGSLMYSSAWRPGPLSNYTQSHHWSYFVGSGVFCFKVCDPAGSQDASLCEHRYDRVGCDLNAPANYAAINGTFQSCQGDNQLPVGTYVTNGQTMTWDQPPESLGPITSVPYTAAVPASSNCQSFTSASIYTELFPTSTSTSSSASSTASGSSRSGASASKSTPTSGVPSATGGSSNNQSSGAASAREGSVQLGALISMVLAACVSIGMTMVA